MMSKTRIVVFTLAFMCIGAGGHRAWIAYASARAQRDELAVRPAVERAYVEFCACLMGPNLEHEEEASDRLRAILLNPKTAGDKTWPARCDAYALSLQTAAASAKYTTLFDDLAASAGAERLALQRGQVPTGIDGLVTIARAAHVFASEARGISPAPVALPLFRARDLNAIASDVVEVVEATNRRVVFGGRAYAACSFEDAGVHCETTSARPARLPDLASPYAFSLSDESDRRDALRILVRQSVCGASGVLCVGLREEMIDGLSEKPRIAALGDDVVLFQNLSESGGLKYRLGRVGALQDVPDLPFIEDASHRGFMPRDVRLLEAGKYVDIVFLHDRSAYALRMNQHGVILPVPVL